MYNIVVIGLGALGKRHLSSILNTKLSLDVFCYDVNPNVLDGFEWEDIYHNKSLKIVDAFEKLPDSIDFALFSMVSKGRREAFDALVEKKKVKNILFEKVLFQKIDDYVHVGKRIEELEIKAWVNCARRQMDSYQKLKEELSMAKEMRIVISGGEWGLACNAIHEIDLVEFLSGSNDTVINKIDLLPIVVDSKRSGYKEVYGTIEGKSGRCSFFSINCMKDTNVPDIMTISTDIGQYIVYEGKRKLYTLTEKNQYEIEERDFDMPYQSQMTQLVMEDILQNGKSRLVEFDDSARLHLQFINPMLEFFEKMGMEKGICPIT